MSSRERCALASPEAVARAEALIRSLAGVREAALRLDDAGRVAGIAVVAEDGVPPWEVIRNVQSALRAAFDLTVDAGVIAVIQATSAAADVASAGPPAASRDASGRGNAASAAGAEARERASSPASAATSPTRLARLEVTSASGGRISCRATLTSGNAIRVGEAVGPDTPAARLETVGRAVIFAHPAADTCEMEGVRQIEIAGRPYIVAALRIVGGRRATYRADVVAVDSSPEHAAALATLGALARECEPPQKVRKTN